MAAAASILQVNDPAFFVDDTQQADLAKHLISMEIEDSVQGLARSEVRLGNWDSKNDKIDYLYFDRKTVEFGKTLKVKLGDTTLVEGRITALEALFPEGKKPEVCVLLEDRFQDLRMTRRTRSFADVSDSDIIQQIASDHSLQSQVDVTGPTHKHIAQVNQSDLAFLRERARGLDAELWMEGTTLHVAQHDRRTGTPFDLSYGRNLREFRATADISGQRTSVTVAGWDVSSKSSVTSETDSSAISSELGNLTSGVSILEDKIGARKESLTHIIARNSDEAQAISQAFFRISARRFVVAHGVADPAAELRVGAFVNVKNVGSLFGGKYYVSAVCHLYDRSKGMRTSFTAERAGLGEAA